jgi:hypothetical protein
MPEQNLEILAARLAELRTINLVMGKAGAIAPPLISLWLVYKLLRYPVRMVLIVTVSCPMALSVIPLRLCFPSMKEGIQALAEALTLFFCEWLELIIPLIIMGASLWWLAVALDWHSLDARSL